MNKLQSFASAFKAVFFAAILFLSSCSQEAPEIPEIEYALVWKIKDFLV